MQLLAAEEPGGAIPEATEGRWGARMAPESGAEKRLLVEFIGMALDRLRERPWPLHRRDGTTTEWVVKISLASRAEDEAGFFVGYLETTLAEFDPARCLDGECIQVEFWVEDHPSGTRVCWRMPTSSLGHAQENYLPHRPVLFLEDP